MAAPPLTIAVEPLVAGKVTYLPLAKSSTGASEQFKLAIRLDMTNISLSAVIVSKIRISFPSSTVAGADMVGLELSDSWHPKGGGPTIAPAQTKIWSNGTVKFPDESTASNTLYRDTPAPPNVRVSVWCEGFSSPRTVTLGLDNHSSQNDEGYYMWPLRSTAKKSQFPTTFYRTSAEHWASGGPWGNQIYAHDITAWRWANGWTNLEPGGSKSTNGNYLIWGRDVVAMADGTVESTLNTMNDNATPGSGFPTPTPDPACGNHVVVKHGSERMLYCHLRKGSIPQEIVAGAQVQPGDKLGAIGNSGNSTEPHTHIEVSSLTGKLRPIIFRGLQVCAPSLAQPPTSQSPWTKVEYSGIPRDLVLIQRGTGGKTPKDKPRKRKPPFPKPRIPHSKKKKATKGKKR